MTDFIKPFTLKEGLFRGEVVRVSKAIKEIMKRRAYPKPIAELISEAVVLSALLSSGLKYDGIFTLQIKSKEGIVSDIVADITSEGKIRAYAKFDSSALEKISPSEIKDRGSVPALLKAGYMVFTIDTAGGTERYQGMVELEGDTLATCAVNYFNRSEQLKTAIKIATDGKSAGGIMLQQMPASGGKKQTKLSKDEIADEWNTDIILLASLKDKEMLDDKLQPEDLLYRLYHEQDITVYPEKKLSFGCRCSEERIKAVLKTLPEKDLKAATEKGKINMTCEFCGTSYYIDAKEIKETK